MEEIKLEARNEHTTGWVFHAYMKVFWKWLEIIGDAAENLEQIENAVSDCIESKEVMDRLLIKRDLPTLPHVSRGNEPTSKNSVPYIQPCYALHDIETPSASRSGQYSSRQIQSIQSSRYCSCSGFLQCSAAVQSLPYCQAMQASFQYTEMNFEPKSNDESKMPPKQPGKGKKRKTAQFQDKMKLNKLESYATDNAKQNLLSNNIPIRQCDYDIYMDYVVSRVMKECHVSRKTVLSITYKNFCDVEEVTTKRNERLYILYCGTPKLTLKKEVYNDFDFYGKIARPKLLAYLDAQKIEHDKSDADTFLFLSFNGKAAFGQLDVHKHLNPFQSGYYPCSTGVSSSDAERCDVRDMETEDGLRSQISTSSASSTLYGNPCDKDLCLETCNLPEIAESNSSLNNEHAVSIQQNDSYSVLVNSKRKHNEEINENHDCNDNEVITGLKRLPESRCFEVENEMSPECIPVEEDRNQEIAEPFSTHHRDTANNNEAVQENVSDIYISVENLIRDIDEELACATSV